MQKQSKLTLFSNEYAGKPKLKDGQPIVHNGYKLENGSFNAVIDLSEDLKAGEYVAELYVSTSKTGKKYWYGKIRPKFKPKQIDAHNQAKANGYQPEAEEIDDEIPF